MRNSFFILMLFFLWAAVFSRSTDSNDRSGDKCITNVNSFSLPIGNNSSVADDKFVKLKGDKIHFSGVLSVRLYLPFQDENR